MSFLWRELLWLMLALPLLPVAYVWLLQRRRRSALRYSSVRIASEAARASRWRRHVPPLLLLVALAGLLLAVSRPVARVSLPWARSTIMLAMDVSLSMRVDDVKPTRLEAAQEAAKAFLQYLPSDIEVGLVTFAGSSHVAQRPTLDRPALATAIDRFQMQLGTAVGDAIVLCLAELFPDQGITVDEGAWSHGTQGRSLDEQEKKAPKPVTPVAPGSYPSAAIILLSDGRRTTGMDTLHAARMAADRGVRIYVVGLGSPSDAATFNGLPIYVQLDEPTLREVARMTDGQYHHAGTAEMLRGVYQNLGSRLEVEVRETELTGLLSFASALLALAGGGLSVLWFGRIA
ncbi:VWA domain-containing protein [Ramlibacter sp.]|uniref:VWA domain-containing protein n=1 Tax=Ramlibacter sp. TaxID=1917967 RepID=UPI002D5B476F|nr:VWA domain-containing protein [Ramlibacter sp.]HYD76439.1 VWA domain-containing protein [Ramlibacter sp.]